MTERETHTYDIGDTVTVFNSTLGGRFFIEARGTVKSRMDTDEQYKVAFEDGVYERFVDPAGQADPEAFVTWLNGMK